MRYMYEAVQRNPNSWHEDGTYELMATGEMHEELFDALVEADARSLAEAEDKPSWTVEQVAIPTGVPVTEEDIAACDIEPLNVYDYLVSVMGVSHEEAKRLVS